ncbi:CopG family transcriptional regulator [Euhalothece natronophila Z-M001]|uniref:CopG family transcriptional regulator n=1 Tax=Euhalothece natronophila Z-M001 TaxID=522448 RepID=A0A5B8NI04_9CHRO|nr:CopG family transcriptional regulator [Euhalothece natronophila]QDZ38823.1 CopG family transcriptional regulator [Euhalothece natronophila Z-M001]
MKRFTLRLSEAEYLKLKNYCDELHISMNDVVRQLIREWQPKPEISLQVRNQGNQ